ncbi:MAG: M28 family peptidase [Gemmatimonadaceae bacterium]|nr:M28 family peptidase [Gemmatimonadaceae bacterium]
MIFRILARIATCAALSAVAAACVASTTRGVRVATKEAAGTRTGAEPLDATIGLRLDPAIASLLGEISPSRIRQTDSILVAFGTRHTMADTTSATRGIGAARRFLFERLSGYSRDCNGCLRVEYDPAMIEVTRHPQRPRVNVVNVLAWLPGRDTSRVIVIGGHYDSCICNVDRFDFTSDAPGADDDGSGTSAVVELARVFSQRYPGGLEATVVFALYSGEELGLLGSTHLAQRLHDSGYKVAAAVTNDIVGNVVADDGRVDSTSVRVFGADPDNSPSRELARYAWASGMLYSPAFAVYPVFRLDRISRGGDHSPFVTHRDAGLRFTERLENYKRQHLPTDRLADVNFGYVANVARLNAATLGALASAPPVPDSVTARRNQPSGGQKWMLSWKPVPGAVAYEVLVRRTIAPTHEKLIRVNGATSYLLSDQLDDLWAGVRSVGVNGHRSLTVVVPPPTFVTR